MAGSVNKVILVGHLGKDAETKFTPAGASVTPWPGIGLLGAVGGLFSPSGVTVIYGNNGSGKSG